MISAGLLILYPIVLLAMIFLLWVLYHFVAESRPSGEPGFVATHSFKISLEFRLPASAANTSSSKSRVQSVWHGR